MDNIIVRPATIADVNFIHEFVCRLENENFDAGTFGKLYAECLASNKNHYLVATFDDKPIGYLSCHGQTLLHHLGLVYEIQELFVNSGFRSRGVGRQLLKKPEEIIGKEDYKLLEVASNIKRTEAHKFYMNNGFNKTTYKFNKVPE